MDAGEEGLFDRYGINKVLERRKAKSANTYVYGSRPQGNHQHWLQWLSLDEEVVKQELSTTIIVHLHHQIFFSTMSKIQHRPSVEARREQICQVTHRDLDPGKLSKL